MHFTKIKLVEEKVEISYIKRNGEKHDSYSMESNDAPLPSFNLKLQDLKETLLELCEQNINDDILERTTVSTIHLKYIGDDLIPGVVISGKMKFKNSNGALALNTPFKYMDYLSDNMDEKTLLDDDAILAINNVKGEAQKFLKGERAQEELFEEDKAEDNQETTGDYVVKNNGEHCKIAAGYANRLTALVNDKRVKLTYLDNDKKFIVLGNDDNAIIFEKKNNYLHISDLRIEGVEQMASSSEKNEIYHSIEEVEKFYEKYLQESS